MKLRDLTVVIEKGREGYVATCPQLGVAVQGRTLGEADAMIHDAVRQLLEEADKAEIRCRLNQCVAYHPWYPDV